MLQFLFLLLMGLSVAELERKEWLLRLIFLDPRLILNLVATKIKKFDPAESGKVHPFLGPWGQGNVSRISFEPWCLVRNWYLAMPEEYSIVLYCVFISTLMFGQRLLSSYVSRVLYCLRVRLSSRWNLIYMEIWTEAYSHCQTFSYYILTKIKL